MKKKLIIITTFLMMLGCTNQNIAKNPVVKRPSKPTRGDSYIFKSRISHEQNTSNIVVVDKENIRLFLRTRSDDIEKVNLVYDDGEINTLEMNKVGIVGLSEYYVADVKLKNDSIKYHFEIIDGKAILYYSERITEKKDEIEDFNYILDQKRLVNPPKWAEDVVWYQIFPERFKNGNKDNDPIYNEYGPQSFKKPLEKLSNGTLKSSLIPEERWNSRFDKWNAGDFTINKWGSDWNKYEEWEDKAREKNDWDHGNTRHYGGDIQGVIEKLDYIKEMGFTAIWFNPVFYAESNHKYDTADYRHISPAYGVIEETGENQGIEVAPDNKYGTKTRNKNGDSEYKLLSYDIKTGRNGLGETSDPATWVWTESDLIAIKMIKEAHKRGIRVIFDGVFNHTGNEFWAFTEALIEGPTSDYADWYKFSDWRKANKYSKENIEEWNPAIEYSGEAKYGVFKKDGENYRRKWVETEKKATPKEQWEIYLWNKENVEYESWWGYRSLPKLDHYNEKVGKHMLDISNKWILGPDGKSSEDWKNDDGIDGFRLDVPLDIENQEFWETWKKEIRESKKDIYTTAEIWGEEAREHIYSDKFDAAMNYEFGGNLLKYIVNTGKREKISSSELKTAQELLFLRNADKTAKVLQNLMSSHDTDRVFSMVINPNREYDRDNRILENRSYRAIRPDLYDNNAVKNMKLISLMQMTYVGAPMMYYGDEKGMWGADDPQDRKPMLWDDIEYEKETETLDKYRKKNVEFSDEVQVDEANGMISYPVKENEELNSWYKKIIEIRNDNIELYSNGELKYILTDDDKNILAYQRENDEKVSIVIVNNNDKKQKIKIPTEVSGKYIELTKDEEYETFEKNIELDLEGKTGIILYLKK